MAGRSIRERRRLATSLLVALAVALSLATAPGALAAGLGVNPSSGVPGGSVTATASGFPQGPVTFRWDNSQLLGTATANAQGTAVLQFSIPGGASPGQHFVRACDANKCPQGDVFADATVTVVASPTPPPTPSPPPTPAPTPTRTPAPTSTPAPTPRITPRPTLRPTPRPTPRPPGVTPEPSVAPPSVPASPSPSAAPSLAPPAAATTAPTASPVASNGGVVVVPTPVPAEATPTPVPLPAAPASEVDPFVGRLFPPIALILGLVLTGFMVAKVRGRSAQGALAGGDGRGLEPELYSALADPVAPFLEPVRHPDDAAEDAWANVRTIAVHVEEIEPREE